MRQQHRSTLLLAMLLLAAAFSCERRTLEVQLDEQVSVRIVVNWQTNFVELYGSQPNGMTVMIWGAEDQAPLVRTTNSDYVTVRLLPGSYKVVIFNELADDYLPYISFQNADRFGQIAQRAVRYGSRADGDYMFTPEDPRIAVAVDSFTVTTEMVLQDSTKFVTYDEYKQEGFSAFKESVKVFEIPETPWPMTVDLYVRIKFRNRHSIRSVNGSISGMADGFYLTRIVRTTEPGTVCFNPENWDYTKLSDDDDNIGAVSTRIASFGLPYGKELVEERDSADNILTLDVELYNDSVIHRSFKVGKDIRYIKPDGNEARIRYRQDLQNLQLIILLPDTVDLPWVMPPGGAGFDAKVDEWEDGGTFDIGGF